MMVTGNGQVLQVVGHRLRVTAAHVQEVNVIDDEDLGAQRQDRVHRTGREGVGVTGGR
jgi:hypothetical protein